MAVGQPPGSMVLMHNGVSIPIENVAIGDDVVSPLPDGTCTTARVVDMIPSSPSPVFKIETTGRGGRRSYRCGERQILPVLGPASRRPQTLREISLANFSHAAPSYRRQAKIFVAPAWDVPPAVLPVHPYVLGILLGNGCFTRIMPRALGGKGVLTLTIRDECVIEKAEEFGLTYSNRVWHKGCYSLYVTGETREALRSSWLAGRNSHTKLIEHEYFAASLEQRLWLLAGLIDTDGTRKTYTTVSEALANDFVELIYSIGGLAKKAGQITTCNGKRFPSYYVNYSSAEHQIPVQCERKRQAPRNMAWKNPRNTSFHVIPDGEAPLIRLVLSGGREWYVTDDWLVVSAASPEATSCTRLQDETNVEMQGHLI